MSESFNRVAQKNLTIAPVTIYTAPSKTSLVSAFFTNSGDNEADITVTILNNTDAEIFRLAPTAFPIPSKAGYEVVPDRIFLLQGDKLVVVCSEDNVIDGIISVVEGVP